MRLRRSMLGWLLAGCAVLMAGHGFAAVTADDIDRRLRNADEVKRTTLAGFNAELDALQGLQSQSSQRQREQFEFLLAWRDVLTGRYPEGIAALERLMAEGADPIVRFRSEVTLVNALATVRRYAESYEHMHAVLAALDGIDDPAARAQGLGAAAQLLNDVAEYPQSLLYSTRLLDESTQPWSRCVATYMMYEARIGSGELRDVDDELSRSADDCAQIGDQVVAGVMRDQIARLHLQNGRPSEAIAVLRENLAGIEATGFPILLATVKASLARAYLDLGQTEDAAKWAHAAIDHTPSGAYPLALGEAWHVLYQIAEGAGDYQEALRALEQHQKADRANLDDVSRRALAYQMARHQARAKSIEIESLSRENQVQHLVGERTLNIARLLSVLLLVILGLTALLMVRTRRMRQQFQQSAQRDALTDCASRPFFIEAVTRTLAPLKQAAGSGALILFDIDHFRRVNDQHGHAAGDELLQQAAACVRRELGPQGLLGRLGGEEFAVFLPEADHARALACAERLRAALHGVRYGPADAQTTLAASFGFSLTTVSGYEWRQLAKHADSALHAAKADGRDRVVGYRSGDRSAAPT